ncbi:MAG TPA: CHASE domain-containing protein [Acidimicrobiia bacterium]|nr:CHASE domain-containing protein [Acidimicrobiia bacterium]
MFSRKTPRREISARFSRPDSARRPAWRAAVVIAAVGIMLTGLLTWWLWDHSKNEASHALAAKGAALSETVDGALDEVVERLVSLGSFYQASGEVTQEEFRTFIANSTPVQGMGGIGYMPIVLPEEREAFEAEVAETIPGYFIFEFDERGSRVPARVRGFHVPVLWFEPAEAFGRPHGFDSNSEPNRRSALTRARVEKEPAVTPFLTLVSEEEDDGFLVYWPVTDPETNEVVGFTVAPMDLSELMDAQMSGVTTDDIDWEISVLTDGRRPHAQTADTWSTVIDVGSAWWALTVTGVDKEGFEPTGSQTTIFLVAVAGLVVSLLVAGGYYQYRRKNQTQHELDQVRALARSKDQFLASVSHELRTPLTGVLGFAELLRDGPDELSEDERRSMISSVAEEASDLAAIIDDLLVAARSELDLLAITRVPVSLRAQIAQVLETSDATLRDRVELVGDPRQTAIGDPGRVRQIIRNLITNAVRYGGERIEIRFGVGDGLVRVEVADDGVGLERENWERIFEPYFRVHEESNTQPAAIGIGLSVARHLARLMDGDLTYRREAGWSVFRLSLPGAPVVTREEAQELESISS